MKKTILFFAFITICLCSIVACEDKGIENQPDDVQNQLSIDNPDEKPKSSTHEHSYTNKNTDAKYLKSTANCTAPAVYYYSCECEEKSTDTFTYGEKTSHTFNQKVTDKKYLKTAATTSNPANSNPLERPPHPQNKSTTGIFSPRFLDKYATSNF